jgi:endogenous inhibitor of DNA gyrase (YacG/DUF329 family)
MSAFFVLHFFVRQASFFPVGSEDECSQTGGIPMTDNQKSLIDAMRRDGYGYAKIARAIGVSDNTVKSYCRRQNSAVAKEKTPICDECGKPIDKSKRGSRRFCSDSCRMKWWNKHPKANMPLTSHCACCGKEIHMRRKDERKYCSHRCYITARYKDGSGNG